jgi:hypothetical protein
LNNKAFGHRQGAENAWLSGLGRHWLPLRAHAKLGRSVDVGDEAREMMKARIAGVMLGVGLFGLTGTVPAEAETSVNVGALSCHVSGGVGFIFGSSKDLDCVFKHPDGETERYHGEINKYGVDIGFTTESRIIWGVFAPGKVEKGALAGHYGGVSGEAEVGLGLGANVLLGGSSKQIALQPLSVTGGIGLNVAAGIASITLEAGK